MLHRTSTSSYSTYNTVQSSATATRNSTDHRSTSECWEMKSAKHGSSSRGQAQHSDPYGEELERTNRCSESSHASCSSGDRNNLSLSFNDQLQQSDTIEHARVHRTFVSRLIKLNLPTHRSNQRSNADETGSTNNGLTIGVGDQLFHSQSGSTCQGVSEVIWIFVAIRRGLLMIAQLFLLDFVRSITTDRLVTGTIAIGFIRIRLRTIENRILFR